MTRLSHSFSVEYAEKYGVECAILITHFQFWIEQNQAMNRNFHDGRTWMYQSQQEIAAIYPYWNRDKVQDLIKKLVDHKVLIKGNYNQTPFDKTTWYAFENEIMFTKVRNRTIGGSNPHDPKRKTAQPIPDTNPYTKQEQQQQTAAAPFDESLKTQTNSPSLKQSNAESVQLKFYSCLNDVAIPEADKIEMSTRYPEDVVKNAIAWSRHPETKINKGLAPALKWACQTKPNVAEIKKDKTPVDCASFNKTYFREINTVASQNGYRLNSYGLRDGVSNDYVETENDKLYFKDVSFLEQVANYIRKKSIDCRNIFDMIKACQQDFRKQMA